MDVIGAKVLFFYFNIFFYKQMIHSMVVQLLAQVHPLDYSLKIAFYKCIFSLGK